MFPNLVALKIAKVGNPPTEFRLIVSGRDWCYVFFQPRSQVNYSLSSSPFHFHFCLFSPRRPGSKRDVTEGTVAEGSNINFPHKTEIHLIQLHVVFMYLNLFLSQFFCLPMQKTRGLRQKPFERRSGRFTRKNEMLRARKALRYQKQQILKKE